MVDREKVIRALECCILRDPDDHARCSKCPYDGNCVNRLKMDALELLKEQEPRVPLEPLCRYLEVYARTPIYNMRHTAEWWKEELSRQKLEKWTVQPTNEQRKATPWEPTKEG